MFSQRREAERIRIAEHRKFIDDSEIENERKRNETKKQYEDEERKNKEYQEKIRSRQENGSNIVLDRSAKITLIVVCLASSEKYAKIT